MEPKCDGSGDEVYYEYKGKKWLLCETLRPHSHCICGNPIIDGWVGLLCEMCIVYNSGKRLHAMIGHRETREHFDVGAMGLKEKLKGSASD